MNSHSLGLKFPVGRLLEYDQNFFVFSSCVKQETFHVELDKKRLRISILGVRKFLKILKILKIQKGLKLKVQKGFYVESRFILSGCPIFSRV